MSRSAYHTSSMKSCQMVTSSVSSSISHWPLKAKSQLKKTKKAVSTKLLVYSSQLSAAHSSPPIDINVITMSSDEGVDKHSVDEEELGVSLEKELGMLYIQCFIFISI